MLTIGFPDLIAALVIVALASGAIGAVLQYCAAAIHHDHKKGQR